MPHTLILGAAHPTPLAVALLLAPVLGRGGGLLGVIFIVVLMALRIYLRSRRGRGGPWGGGRPPL